MNDLNATLNERGGRYGRFEDNARVSQALKEVVRRYLAEFGTKLAADQSECLEMICHKISRIICGDPAYDDSWHDIAGYAELVVKRLRGSGI